MNDANHIDPDRSFFRCTVQPEDAKATIFIGRKGLKVLLQDRSIDGFSILVDRKQARKLRVGPTWVLHSGGEVTEVLAQWMFNAPDGQVQVGLRRLRDLTPQPKCSLVPNIFAYDKHTTNPGLLMAALLLTVFLTISLPGVGDKLGTSGKIQSGLKMLCEVVSDSVRTIW